jgi:hypothetical protein
MGNVLLGNDALPSEQFWKGILIPFYQVWLRASLYNGSMQWPWFLFPVLLIPPFSLIPIMYINAHGPLEKGTSVTPIADSMLLVPIITKLIGSFIVEEGFSENFLVFGSIFIIFFIRNFTSCMSAANNCTGLGITRRAVTKNVIDAILVYAHAAITLEVIPYIPKIGLLFEGFYMIPFVKSAIWSLLFIVYYCIVVMFNQSSEEFCKDPLSKHTPMLSAGPFFLNIYIIILAIISLVYMFFADEL